MNNNKYSSFSILFFFLIILLNSTTIYAQITGQLELSGDSSPHYGDKKIYSLKDFSNTDGHVGYEYDDFEWFSDGNILTPDTFNKKEVEILWDIYGSQKIVNVLYDLQFDNELYYAELTVNVQYSPGTPEPPTVQSYSNCNQVVLQRSNPPMDNIIWYWQSTPTGTSTANSNPTITLTSGTEYFLRAKANGVWSDASSVQYNISPSTPTVGTITHPTTTTATGSVELSNLPIDGGMWIINPGGITGYETLRTITGLSASTTYNFTVTNAAGCTSTASANVTINGVPSGQLPTPTVGIITQPTCANNSAHFTITNYNPSYTYTAVPSTGVIFNGANVIIQHIEGSNLSYSSSVNFFIKANSGANESYSSAAIVIETQIHTPSTPVVGAITQPSATTTGSVVLSNLPYDYGIWTVNPGNFTGSYNSRGTVTITGLAPSVQPYNFTVTNQAGCTSAPSADVVINNYCGISEENYVHTITPTQETTDVAVLNTDQKIENITYYDGIGRPLQKIAIRAGGNGEDIITYIEYDQFGRQTKEYLPYIDTFNCGAFRGTTLINTTIDKFYNTAKYENTLNPYSEKEFEASPLDKVLKQSAPGNDWKLGNGHEIKLDYQTNTASEVTNYSVNLTYANNTRTPALTKSTVNNGYYNVNELYKSITFDENTAGSIRLESDGSTVEFKNKQGQVLLKRTYGTSIVNGVSLNNVSHDTYYVYDDYGNLSFVIPPKAADIINTGTASIPSNLPYSGNGSNLSLTATNSITLTNFYVPAGSTFSATIVSGSNSTLDDLCYQYKYDQRNRLVEKKLPGKQWEFILYDKLDRVVATGPALSPFNDTSVGVVGWMITKYDALNRAIYTGWEQSTVVNSDGRIVKQNALNSATTFNESKQTSGTIDGVAAYYTNTVTPTSFKLLTVNYYDNYTFPGVATIPTTVESQAVVSYYLWVKGLATGSWTRIPTATSSILGDVATTFYDKKARPVQTYNANYLGGYTYTNSKLDFIGKTEYTITFHKRDANSAELKTKNAFTYSPQGRLMTQSHQINDGTVEQIATNTYDELGQLTSKAVGGNTQKVDYTYNIRGWLKGINNVSALQQGTDPKDLFAFAINYNTIPSGIPNVNALYNGNIAETQWATNSDNGIVRTYGYIYDNLNRLREGIYKKQSTVTNLYNESIDYDKNGNIMHLMRYGSLNDNTQTLIDNLTYNYANSNLSNQLISVDDTVSNNSSFINEFKNTAGNDYSYDANGNMLKDLNKGIGTTTTNGITYNHLNLPTKITFGSTGNIVYIYDAAGQKVQKVVTQGSTITTTDYLGGYQYKNTDLKFFPTAEGYVEPNGSSYKYVYQYKDHLGNVRLSYDKTLAVQEENDYYSFGLKHTGYGYSQVVNSDYKYRYNSKEYQDELGLNFYDYGARNYDPAIGRWFNMDPLAEKYFETSPYVYGVDNPIFFIDPNGEDIYHINADGSINVERTKDDFNLYYLNSVNSDGETQSYELGKFTKNENGLIQLPSSFSFSNGEVSFSFSVKEGNEYRSYVSGDSFASLFGALADSNTQDLTIVGFSLADGSSPDPSTSHKNGKNGDLRYLRNDGTEGPLDIRKNPSKLDEKRQNDLNNSLYKFGWKSQLSFNYEKGGETKLLDRTTHFKNHSNHLHLQGFKPNITNGLNSNVIYVAGTLEAITVTKKNKE